MQHKSSPQGVGAYRAAVVLLLLLALAPAAAQEEVTTMVESSVAEKGDGDWIYYDLGCNDRAWAGYFAPSHWERKLEEAPSNTREQNGPVLREDCLAFPPDRWQEERWSIDAPARGILRFQLVGDSTTLSRVRIFVNGVDQFLEVLPGVPQVTPFLSEGDEFALVVPAGSPALRWEHLRFHTNASGVFFYPGERIGRYRYRPVSGSRIDRVLFPVSRYGGWPVFDYDGDLNTLHDQQELYDDTERFRVEFEDSIQLRAGGYVLLRTFLISENCREGNSLRRDVPWMPLPLLPQ